MKYSVEDKKKFAKIVAATSKKYGLPTSSKSDKDKKKSK